MLPCTSLLLCKYLQSLLLATQTIAQTSGFTPAYQINLISQKQSERTGSRTIVCKEHFYLFLFESGNLEEAGLKDYSSWFPGFLFLYANLRKEIIKIMCRDFVFEIIERKLFLFFELLHERSSPLLFQEIPSIFCLKWSEL